MQIHRCLVGQDRQDAAKQAAVGGRRRRDVDGIRRRRKGGQLRGQRLHRRPRQHRQLQANGLAVSAARTQLAPELLTTTSLRRAGRQPFRYNSEALTS